MEHRTAVNYEFNSFVACSLIKGIYMDNVIYSAEVTLLLLITYIIIIVKNRRLSFLSREIISTVRKLRAIPIERMRDPCSQINRINGTSRHGSFLFLAKFLLVKLMLSSFKGR